jgi:hypothetical protein
MIVLDNILSTVQDQAAWMQGLSTASNQHFEVCTVCLFVNSVSTGPLTLQAEFYS